MSCVLPGGGELQLLEEVAVTLGAARDAAGGRSRRGFVNRMMLQRGWLVHSHTSSDRTVCTVRGHQQMFNLIQFQTKLNLICRKHSVQGRNDLQLTLVVKYLGWVYF